MEEKRKLSPDELHAILGEIGPSGVSASSVTAFVSDEDGSEYDVWLVDTGKNRYVLKRAKAFEVDVYRTFFTAKKPYVPEFLGSCEHGGNTYFLTEYCPGNDLRYCDRRRLTKALDALVVMQDEFWGREDLYGTAVTREYALREVRDRGQYLRSGLLEKVYEEFTHIYTETPLTLCHDDLLPINVIVGERAVLIDWEYGGMLPYLTSLARLIAHGRDEKDAFFCLTEEDRSYAVEYYYVNLVRRHGIPYGKYRQALDYFLFYEYCEWIMLGNRYGNQEDERYGYYLKKAEETTRSLMRQRSPHNGRTDPD